MARRWSEEEKELIIKLRKEGFSAREMVPYFDNRTEATIKNLASKLCPKNSKWTEEEDRILLELYSEGKSTKQIAKQLPGRTLASIRTRIQATLLATGEATRKQTKPIQWSVDKVELLIKLREEGKTYKEIGEALGDISESTVANKMVELMKRGKVIPKQIQKDWTEEEEALVCELRSQNVSNGQIAERLGRTLGSVANHISLLIKQGRLDPYGNIDRNYPCKLYLIYFTEENFYKIGITQNTINTRFQGYPTYKIIEVLNFDTLEKAREVEARVKKMVEPYQYHPLVFKYGATECFQVTTPINSIMDLVAYLETSEK